jgi:hypothetical protein
VAGPPRIFTAFLVSGTRLLDVYIKTGKLVNGLEISYNNPINLLY